MTTERIALPRAPFQSLRLGLGAALRAYIERESLRRQRRALAGLNDYLLRDIGLTRDDVRNLPW